MAQIKQLGHCRENHTLRRPRNVGRSYAAWRQHDRTNVRRIVRNTGVTVNVTRWIHPSDRRDSLSPSLLVVGGSTPFFVVRSSELVRYPQRRVEPEGDLSGSSCPSAIAPYR